MIRRGGREGRRGRFVGKGGERRGIQATASIKAQTESRGGREGVLERRNVGSKVT